MVGWRFLKFPTDLGLWRVPTATQGNLSGDAGTLLTSAHLLLPESSPGHLGARRVPHHRFRSFRVTFGMTREGVQVNVASNGIHPQSRDCFKFHRSLFAARPNQAPAVGVPRGFQELPAESRQAPQGHSPRRAKPIWVG